MAYLGEMVDNVNPETSWMDLLAPIVGAYTQKQLIDINADRLRQGLPPLANTTALNPTVNVAVPDAVQNSINSAINIAVIGVLALGAIMLITRKRGRKNGR